MPDDNKTTPPDIMPDPIDDSADSTEREIAQEPVDNGQDDQGQEPIESEGAFDSDREAIVRRYRAQRSKGKPLVPQEENNDGQDGDEPPAQQQARQQQDDPPQRQQQPPQNTPPTPPPEDPEFPLVINGRVVTKKLSEIIGHAQRDLAADGRLEEAKALLREARALRADPNGTEHPPADQGQKKAPQQTTESRGTSPAHPPADVEIEEELLDRVAQGLQVGDQSDGREVLKTFAKTIIEKVQSHTSRAPDETAIREMTRRELQEAERQREIDEALTSFSQDFSHIIQDDDLTEVAQTRLKAELRADLQRAGVAAEDLDKLTNPTALAAAHRSLRMQGAKLRTYKEVLSDVGNHLTYKFGKPSGTAPGQTQSPPRSVQPPQTPARNVIAERQDLKRNAPQQPRAAGVRGTPPSQQPKAPKSRLDIIAEMRRGRGFN